MTRYIDADSLEPYYRLMQDNETGIKMMALPDGIVDQQPTVDAVPVVRCEQCTWWYMGECMFWAGDGMYTEYDDYCSRGKMREDVAK